MGTDILITSANCNHHVCKLTEGVFTKYSSFLTSYLVFTVEFTPFLGCLQLDHPVTCENIKCYSHTQIIT